MKHTHPTSCSDLELHVLTVSLFKYEVHTFKHMQLYVPEVRARLHYVICTRTMTAGDDLICPLGQTTRASSFRLNVRESPSTFNLQLALPRNPRPCLAVFIIALILMLMLIPY